MKSRKTLLALAALVLFSWNATAQSVRTQALRKQITPLSSTMGSIERCKLLGQLRGSRAGADLSRYGSVARRAALSQAGYTSRSPFRKPAQPTVYSRRARGI